MRNTKFYFRQEELPVVADIIKISLKRDSEDFKNYSPDFNAEYITKFETKIARVNGILYPEVLTKELKTVTERLAENVTGMRPMLRRLQGYVNRAADTLTINPGDFGFKELRQEITYRDVEGIVERLRILMVNVHNNNSALAQKGLKDAMIHDFSEREKQIYEDNLLQEEKLQERRQLVVDNEDIFRDLWYTMKDIADVGKILYRYDNPEKARDYTMSMLKKRVRREKKEFVK